MRRLVHVVLLTFVASVLVFALLREPDASASATYSSGYTFDETYSSAVRLVHVDMGFKILEKDDKMGYVLFEYTSPESGNRVSNGSIEVVETKNGTNVAVSVPAMPQYHEQMIIDALVKKLNRDYGAAPMREKEKDKSKDGDKDKDKSKDGDKDKDKDKDKDGDKDRDKDKDGDKDKDKDRDKDD